MTDQSVETPSATDAFREHWEQLRHVERLRYGFANVYVVILGGLLAVGIDAGGSARAVTAGFVLLLSITSVVTNVKLGLEYYHHQQYVTELADRAGIASEMGRSLGMYGGFDRSIGAITETDVLRPSSAETGELLSPGHWILGLSVVATVFSAGWVVVIAFGVPVDTTRTVAWLLLLVVVLTAVRLYVHRKTDRIAQLVERRVSDEQG